MGYYEEGFYHEPSEFEMKMDELKESLLNSIKEEYVTEMERLKQENKELQDTKKEFNTIKDEYRRKEMQLEYERNEMQRKLRSERLVDLLKDHKVILYKAYSKREYPPKCDICDGNRKIQYITPLGRNASEDCQCKEGKVIYYPHEFIRYEFRLNRDKNGLTAWYRQYSDDEDGLITDHSFHVNNIYSSEMKYEDLKQYSTFFKTEEECQRYCDFLNSKKEGEGK